MNPGRVPDGSTDTENPPTFAEFFDFLSSAFKLNSDLNDKNSRQKPRIAWDELSSNRLVGKLLTQNDDAPDVRGGREKRFQVATDNKTNSFTSQCRNLRISTTSELERTSTTPIDDAEVYLDAALKSVLNEGVLDSILPFIVPKLHFAETAAKLKHLEQSKKQEELHIQRTTKEYLGFMKSGGSHEQKNSDVEIEIQVCDEIRHKTKGFKCPRSLLLTQMAYFADVTSGQRLEDMDISVHCDLTIFEWLMKWIKSTVNNENVPLLHNLNVIPVLVSATFLQMNPLIQECISYFKSNMDDVIRTSSSNLSCLNDAVIAKIADALTNLELDSMDDQKDKIKSRLFCKFIVLLARKEPESFRGHYLSISSLFKCHLCKKILHSHFACWIPCLQNNVKLDKCGIMQAIHEMDEYWNVNFFIKDLKNEVKSWRKVYWRVWGTCHYLKCINCLCYYPVKSTNYCRHHSQFPEFFPTNEGRQVSITELIHLEGGKKERQIGDVPVPNQRLPVTAPPLLMSFVQDSGIQFPSVLIGRYLETEGKYMCCGEKTYRFEVLPSFSGCDFRQHQPSIPPQFQGISKILDQKSDLIFVNPPRMGNRLKLLKELDQFSDHHSKDRPSEVHGDHIKNEYFSWYNVQIVPHFVPTHLHKDHPAIEMVDEDVEEDDFQDTESGSSSSKYNQLLFDFKRDYCSSSDEVDSSSVEDEGALGEDSPTQSNFVPTCHQTFRNRSHKKRLKSSKKWMPKLSIRCNQDNQREREEGLMRGYIQKLAKHGINQDLTKIQKCTVVIPRTCMTSSLSIKGFDQDLKEAS